MVENLQSSQEQCRFLAEKEEKKDKSSKEEKPTSQKTHVLGISYSMCPGMTSNITFMANKPTDFTRIDFHFLLTTHFNMQTGDL